MTEPERFEFGKNWQSFLATLDEERIDASKCALQNMLGINSLSGKSFLDIGSGSGLSSLAARQLGARVYSFDFDLQSVACTLELKRRFFFDDDQWTIEQGNILDVEYLKSLGQFDIVYSWGVLHHTGSMWQALNNVIDLVAAKGTLHIAIYNDQGKWSAIWKKIKKTYNSLPSMFQPLFVLLVMIPRELRSLAYSLIIRHPHRYIANWTQYKKNRGMNRWHDLVDWVGGYPFEVAKPEEIFDFYHDRGFILKRLKTCGSGHGCNEFVFQKNS